MFNGAAAGDPMPLGVAIGLGVLLFAVGLLLADVAIRSHNGNLSRNWIVGIRTQVTLESDEAWEAAHRAAASSLWIGAAGSLVAGIVILFRPSNAWGMAIILMGVGWLLLWVYRGAMLGTRAARERVR